MKKYILFVFAFMLCAGSVSAQFVVVDNRPVFGVDGNNVITVPQDGLWSVATGWQDDWMCGWNHADPQKVEKSGEWTILSGRIQLENGDMVLRDSYRQIRDGLVQCIRRYEWTGNETLKNVTLSVRLSMAGDRMMPLLPGVLYYGNKNGAKVNPNIIPVYEGEPGEFAIFEEHRYPMPFAMLENAEGGYAAALHTVPSPIRGAVLADQWWSLGVEAKDGCSEFVMYSGPIGYNGKHSVAKALQKTPMRYADTYINMEPGRIIEKTFYVELYQIEGEGTGFQTPIYTSMDLHRPYDADRFPEFDEIMNTPRNKHVSIWWFIKKIK